jgi:hypothetical protein
MGSMITADRRPRLVAALLAACCLFLGACRQQPEEAAVTGETPAIRVLVVQLDGFVGCGVDAELIRPPLAACLADPAARPDVVVFAIDSGGGMLNRVGPLSDLIYAYFDDDGPLCIGWVERAESAAALVALNIPELWMPPDGVIGGAVGVQPGDNGWEALPSDQQEAIRYMAAACAARGGHDRDLALSLVVPTDPQPRPNGARVLSALDAQEAGLATMARSLEEALDERFGAGAWRIDQDASSRVSAPVEEAEAVRQRFEEVRERFEIALRSAADQDDPASREVADSYLGQALEISTQDNAPTLRAMAFSAGFEWIARASEELRALSGGAGG